MHHYALTIIGRDRPGIVAEVTEILLQPRLQHRRFELHPARRPVRHDP